MPIIETTGEFSHRFARWSANEDLTGYPFIKNIHAPFTPVRRALPMLNLALISSAEQRARVHRAAQAKQ